MTGTSAARTRRRGKPLYRGRPGPVSLRARQRDAGGPGIDSINRVRRARQEDGNETFRQQDSHDSTGQAGRTGHRHDGERRS